MRDNTDWKGLAKLYEKQLKEPWMRKADYMPSHSEMVKLVNDWARYLKQELETRQDMIDQGRSSDREYMRATPLKLASDYVVYNEVEEYTMKIFAKGRGQRLSPNAVQQMALMFAKRCGFRRPADIKNSYPRCWTLGI